MRFEQAMNILPHQWSNSSMSYVFHRDDPGCIPGGCAFLQRLQKSNNCFIHTAIMLQYCLMSRSNGAKAGAIIDAKVFIRDISSSLGLYLFNQGGKASDIFNEIVDGNHKFHQTHFDKIDAEWLKTHGPGILAFGIRNETLVFGSNENLVYKGTPLGHVGSLHSVLIIGVRMEGNSRYFLVQNWWTIQQVVEIREDYAIASLGRAFFITTRNLIVREGLPWTKKKYDQF
jgi:hypothetical protein